MLDHALEPSDAWRIHRRSRAADQRELDEVVNLYVERVISSISLNHLGTREPPPLVHLALTGFVAFAESALDEARTTNAPADEVMRPALRHARRDDRRRGAGDERRDDPDARFELEAAVRQGGPAHLN